MGFDAEEKQYPREDEITWYSSPPIPFAVPPREAQKNRQLPVQTDSDHGASETHSLDAAEGLDDMVHMNTVPQEPFLEDTERKYTTMFDLEQILNKIIPNKKTTLQTYFE